jgi:serine/threonine protein phosphatase 1
VGDIHGNYKALLQAIDRSPFNPQEDRLITIGDYLDGGWHIEIIPIIEYLNLLPNWIGLIGNHDSWMYDAIHNSAMTANKNWLLHGAKQTLHNLGIQYVVFDELIYLRNYPPTIVSDFLESLSLYFIDDDDHVFLHGGWNNPEQRLEESETVLGDRLHELYWDRNLWRDALAREFFPHNKVFIGHTSAMTNPEKRGNIWNLDSAATHGGPITIMDADTEEYWQSDPTSVLYQDFTLRSSEKP